MLISNNYYTLQLNDKNGSIVSLKNKQNKEFICYTIDRDLFTLRFFDENCDKFSLSSNTYTNIKIENSDERTTIFYKGVGGLDIDATVFVAHPKNSPFISFDSLRFLII